MKKSVKIILIIVAVLIIGGGYFAYSIYQMVSGSEKLVGKKENIPASTSTAAMVEKGNADWPNWRGANFDGKSATLGIIKDWTNGLEKNWQIDYLCQGRATASWSAPVVVGNRLIVPGRNDESDIVFCINTENGELIWKSSYKSETNTNHGPGARATPFIDENRIYTFGRNGDLVCWQLEDGKLLWHKKVKELGGSEPQWGYSGTPLVYNNMVIVQGGGKSLVIAFDKFNGDVIWKSMEGEAGYSFTIPYKENILVYHGTGLSLLNSENGKEYWNVPWPTEYFVNATTPIIQDDIVFHSSGYGIGSQAIKVKDNSYEVLWKDENFQAQHTDPVLIDGYIYGYSGESSRNNGDFKCIELVSGKEMWTTDEIGQGTLTYVDGHLVCLDIKGNLFLVKPDTDKFQKVGEIKAAIESVRNPAWTVPVVANGKLYLRYMQRLVCYNLGQS